MTTTRIEHDAFGDIEVPADALWGAQTQRSLMHFRISTERMPEALLMALARVKRVAARVNGELGLLEAPLAQAIAQAADEVLAGAHAGEFPLSVWQTGSGTQTNMNMNEVLANRASELLGGARGASRRVHPNDHVNLGQSSNDVIPTAMHVAAVTVIVNDLLPALRGLRRTLADKSAAFADIVKIGRTHLQDATPLTLGQEVSGWVAQLDLAEQAIAAGLAPLHELAIGGHRGRHRAQHAPAVRPARRRRPGRRHRPAVPLRVQPLRGPRRARCAGARPRRAEGAGGGADQDRQRRALAGVRPALRPGRAAPAGERTRQLDHARQGQPDPVRSTRHGRGPGDGQRRGRVDRRRLGPVRIEHRQAG